ncbi:MAG: serine/threonine-protein kinase, partial [Pirellulaceae bacterium]|nr:serine/threonine-protein kinase [Pirellulaceae bacterium]
MSRLLGKIRLSPGDESSPAVPASNQPAESASHESTLRGLGDNHDDTPVGADRGRHHFRETTSGPSVDRHLTSPRPMTFTYAPGSKPLSQYTIRRGIGVGGFGEVYFAVSEAGKEVALKRIQRNLEVEIRGASHCLNLKHNHLVSLYDICRDDDDQAWVVMEFVAGPNLRQVLDQSPQGLSEVEVRRWFSAIAAGVNHLHCAGLVHRDLKPGNVFDDMGVVKVGDYGLSKFISASHRGGHTESVGTFHYMAPEIGRGQYGREIDIYALGIVLYEMLTGQVPFDGESCHEIIVKHLTAQPDLSGIAEPYRSVIHRSLQKDPQQRPATIAEMLAPLGLAEPTASPIASARYQNGHEQDQRVADQRAAPVLATAIGGPRLTQPVARFDADTAPNGIDPNNHSANHSSPDGTIVIGPPKSDEPLARAVRESANDLKNWWATLDRSPGAKTFMLIVAGLALLINTHWLLPVLSLVGIVYVPYYIVRHMVLHVNQQPTYAQAQRIATASGIPPAKPVTKTQWRSQMRHQLQAKHGIHRVAELSTSWIAATLTVLALTIVAGVIGLRSGDVTSFAIAPFGWMAMVVLLSSLTILAMGKLWEPDEGEALPRRLVMAGIGAGVGVAAFMISEFLMLPDSQGLARDVNASGLPQALYQVDGTPRASAMMAHFALLFAAVRWWKPVDPLRRTRLSLWSVSVTVGAAWAIHQILPIAQPYG